MKLIATIGLFFVFLFGPEAKAQTWVVCDSCQTVSDFEEVAIDHSAPTPNSWYMYAVGNPNTGVFRYVEVSIYRDGEVPAIVYPAPRFKKNKKRIGSVSPSYSDPSLRYSVVSVPADANETQIFVSIAKMNSEEVVAAPPSGIAGFDSFAGADLVQVGLYLWAFKTGLDPNWASEAVGSGSWLGLWDALKMARGKGPIACQVFLNGDSACYQLNPMAPSAPKHVAGTAKNISGQLLDSSTSPGGSIGGGDGDPLNVIQQGNTNEYRWTTGGGSRWLYLMCSSIGGVVQNCYYVIM